MSRKKRIRVAFGTLFWLAAAMCGIGWIFGDDTRLSSSTQVGKQVLGYAIGERRVADLQLEDPYLIATADPIFVYDEQQNARQIGQVAAIPDGENSLRYQAVFYADAPKIDGSSSITYHQTPESLEWVLRTMLPQEKRQQVIQEISVAFEEHHHEIIDELRPIMQDSLSAALVVIEQDLPIAFERRRGEISAIADRYDEQVVDQELVPLVKEEVWPIVRKHAEPAASEVGHEMWQRVSLWRFGWRYVYDKSVLPKKDLTRKEWDRFLEQEAMPVLESHTDDFIDVQKQILADVMRNEKVRASIHTNLERVIDDPEIRKIVWEVFREVIVDNPRVKGIIDEHWRSPRAQAAFQLAADRLEPTAVRIGELIFGSKQEGISPEFARVLRNQILAKDRRWFVLHTDDKKTSFQQFDELVLSVKRGSPYASNPFVPAEAN